MDGQEGRESRADILPEQGGVFWFAGGVPTRSLPAPCVACLDFLGQLDDAELQQLIRRIRARNQEQRNKPSSVQQ